MGNRDAGGMALVDAQRIRLAQIAHALSGRNITLPQLAMVRAEITAAVTNAQQSATTAIDTDKNRIFSAIFDSVRELARDTVQLVWRNLRQFDPFLLFSNDAEREAFELRCARRRARIDRALGLDTPEGDLDASGTTLEQLADTGRHGGHRSPEFRRQVDDTRRHSGRLRDGVRRRGGSTREFDAQLAETIRDLGYRDMPVERFLAAPELPPGLIGESLTPVIGKPTETPGVERNLVATLATGEPEHGLTGAQNRAPSPAATGPTLPRAPRS